MQKDKLDFLQEGMFTALQKLQPGTAGRWGKMNSQQMVEHLAFIFAAASGKIKTVLSIPEAFLPKAKAFLWSDKEFRENTKAPAGLIPEEPQPLKHAGMQQAIDELKTEVNYFVDFFTANPGITTMHPAFGELNFEEWVQIQHKHVVHHLKQFGLL